MQEPALAEWVEITGEFDYFALAQEPASPVDRTGTTLLDLTEAEAWIVETLGFDTPVKIDLFENNLV